MYLLIDGPKQPLRLFVKGHNHVMETGQLRGNLSGDGWVRKLTGAHASILGKQKHSKISYHMVSKTNKTN